jgi:hypothetical protein
MIAKWLSVLLILPILCFVGCAGNIKEVITSNPIGADIYWGRSQKDLVKSGHVTTYSGGVSGSGDDSWCYQVKKEGYQDSEIICVPQRSMVQTVHFDLKPLISKKTESIYRVTLSWEDQSSNEQGFKIERKTGINGTFSEIATVGSNVTRYTDTEVRPATIYFYRVRAYNSAGYSTYSKEVKYKTPDK